MDLLALTHRTPFPPDRGDRIRSHHLLRGLAARHRIWLLSVDDGAADEPTREGLRAFCHRFEVLPMSPVRRLWGAGIGLLRGQPLTLGWFQHPAAEAILRGWNEEVRFDAAFVYSSSMGPYWQREHARSGLPAVMDFIDVDSEKWGQYAQHSAPPKRWIYAREKRTLARYERLLAEEAGEALLVSEAEVATFQRIHPGTRVLALGNGVDGGHFSRPQLARRLDPPRIAFVGQMDYQANIDAVEYFANDVLPLLHRERPDLAFDIVGARPTAAVKALDAQPGVRVTGWVEDVRPYLWEATLAVAPLRIAQGTQNKVLEAMAASLPVVASPLAARGLAVPRGSHLRVAKDAASFAAEILDLLDDPTAAAAQAEAALEFLDKHHSWEAATLQLESLLTRQAQSRPGPGEGA